ncbi:DNA polymerase III subunit gamma/tau [Sporolactobacillus inulinus]|jgi:DNA polymerase-3 subunit gamma/tau|uniref:DNA-directed DNA polymerase n=1 Tax=Sporolactobacillus inulinus CASD TaxID=1069536 RepID=A0A0U1QMG7_9BACL|nr:DNA polymerase III subunit gamma/tau [Sporolactobacillus inulinus]KLI01952.1 DNA polymerase III subunit gamma/tau [Sporolactobacillus inulinus CASD]GEB78346.1 DNA polymerase III subunit gamma/tau [Sporolactobacillus inulinus]
MAYQALYRVYRPQTFHDLAGQQHIAQTLQNALTKQQFSHAYLFTGPRGTGKTSAAKIFAKAINCEQAPTSEPCNECAACRGITAGSIADVIEIDAASNNGVDEIRDIRDKVKYAPSEVRYKVYIIDEVHMLSTGAFNALLKTLEEPPEHAVFILATTEPQKIPLTIISRCQQFDFRRIPSSEIFQRLRFVVQDQHLEAEDEALQLIAKASEGGMRDALSVLDQTAAYSEAAITVQDVLDVTGMVADQMIRELIELLMENNAAAAVGKIGALLDQGKDPLRLMEQMIYYYRDLLLYQTSPQLEELLSRPRVDDAFRKQAETISSGTIFHVINQLNRAFLDMKRTNHPRILLEMAMIRLCEQSEVQATDIEAGAGSDALAKRVDALERQVKLMSAAPQPGVTQQPVQQETKRARAPRRNSGLRIPTAHINRVLEDATKEDLIELRSAWAKVMAKIRSENVAAHAWMLESQPVASSAQGFVQAFKYDFHCQMVMENKNNLLGLVQSIVQDVTHKQKVMYPIPEDAWKKLKKAYIERSKSNQDEDSDGEKQEEDSIIAEAKKLVGPDLLDIKD